MKPAIVLGGLGHFGRIAVEQLRALGIPAQIASRRAEAEIQVDANDPVSIRTAFGEGDLVVDAAGPFQKRSTAVIEAAIEVGFDVIDINDDLNYAERVLGLKDRIDRAGVRVLSSSSSVSAVSAAIVRLSEIRTPTRVTGFLAPASRYTANSGSALSLIQSVGRPVRVLREGQLQTRHGWGEVRRFPMPQPVGRVRGWLFENADAVYLPRIWPSLTEVAMYVDTNTPGVNGPLRLGARFSAVRRFLESQVRVGTWVSRIFGSTAGGLGYEIEDADGMVKRFAILAGESGFVTAVAPAVLAARAILLGQFKTRGLVLPDHHVEPGELIAHLKSSGIDFVELA